MRGPQTILGAFASLSLILAASPLATAQVPERRIPLQRVDGPVPEPTPAPGTRFAKEAAVGPEAEAAAKAAAVPRAVSPPVISSHQIDRYDALEKEQKAVAANPKSLADWIILGELAHEVAMDAPESMAGKYLEMSRHAYEQALRLAPNNAGLKAAVQFARDQQQNADRFQKSRDSYTDTFLEAHRRDLGATGNTPYVEIYEPPLPSRTLPTSIPAPVAPPVSTSSAGGSPAITPAPPHTAATDTANYGTQQNYSAPMQASTYSYSSFGPRYQAFVTPGGAPYTYQQFSNAYFPAGVYSSPAVVPVTPQRYFTTTPVAPNAYERQILNRTAP